MANKPQFVLVDFARYFAIGAHGQQVRKYTGEPYWHHLQNVVNLLISHATNIEFPMLITAWLHDVVEDTPINIWQIGDMFGEDIAQYVSDLTEPSKECGNRETRKRIYNERLIEASPLVQTVKYADMIDNTFSIEEHDPDFAKVYLREKRELVPKLNKGCPVLYEMLVKQLER